MQADEDELCEDGTRTDDGEVPRGEEALFTYNACYMDGSGRMRRTPMVGSETKAN